MAVETKEKGAPDGQAKVCGSDGALLLRGEEQEVVRLDIPVDDALGMALRDEAQHRPGDGTAPLRMRLQTSSLLSRAAHPAAYSRWTLWNPRLIIMLFSKLPPAPEDGQL